MHVCIQGGGGGCCMQEEGQNCADATDGKLTTDNHQPRQYKTMAATPATEGGGIVYSPDEDGNIPDFSLLDSYRENSFSRSREIFEPEGTTCLEFRLEVESRRKKIPLRRRRRSCGTAV